MKPPPFSYTFVCLLCRMAIMHVERKKKGRRGEEKLFAHVVPEFHEVCAEAKAPSGLKTR